MERANREVWAKRVERWQDSGLTAKQFAAELEVSPNSLTFWKWKLRRLANGEGPPIPIPAKRRTSKRKDTAPQFLQLVPTSATDHTPTSSIEIVFVSGVVVRVPRDFDEPTLVRLVGVLGGR
jgi:transposase